MRNLLNKLNNKLMNNVDNVVGCVPVIGVAMVITGALLVSLPIVLPGLAIFGMSFILLEKF